MRKNKRPYALTIAGLDPCAGAGLLADIKTFEAHKVIGFGVCTAITYQNEDIVEGVDWVETHNIIRQIDVLLKKYKIEFVKIGLIQNTEDLKEIVNFIKDKNQEIKIIWDPIMKSGSGFVFNRSITFEKVKNICMNLFLITPNLQEAETLCSTTAYQTAEQLSEFTNVYLKGGHNEIDKGRDYLYMKKNNAQEKNIKNFRPRIKTVREKHGTGCVLSSAITANLAKGYPLLRACLMAKQYVEYFIESNKGLLGYHKL